MRGTILGFDAATGSGAINNLEGGRVRFRREGWRSPGEPIPGRLVDFEMADDEAIDIYVVPGSGNPLSFSGDDPARSAMTAGIISLACAIATFVIPFIGPITLIVSIVFGIKGKNLGRDLPDKTAYYLSIAGLIISGLALAFTILALAACVGMVGLMSLSGPSAW